MQLYVPIDRQIDFKDNTREAYIQTDMGHCEAQIPG